MSGENTQTTLREDLEAAVKASAEKAEPVQTDVTPEVPEVEQIDETPEQKTARERDELGRFKKKEGEEVVTPETEVPLEPVIELKAPQSLKGEMKAKWNELPNEVKEEFIRLESTQAKGMAKIAQSARFGDDVMREVQPYMAMIQAEGSNPQTAIRSLLNTAYLLRTAPPAQKTQLFHQLAQEYGVDLGTPPEKAQVDPNLQYVINELNQLKQQTTGQLTAYQQQQEEALNNQIATFAADPANVHFEALRGEMAALITAGIASDLKDAYDKACWANPEIRSSILSEQRKQEEQKRKLENEKLIASKKQAATPRGSTVTGTPVVSDGDSLRDTISNLYYQNQQRI